MVVVSCKQIQTCAEHGPVREYFALVHWHEHENEGSNTFDVMLTDCSNAWQIKGGQPQGAVRLRDEAWSRAKEALADGTTVPSTYSYWSIESGGELKLFWAWHGRGAGQDVLFVILQQAADAASVIQAMMAHMMASYACIKSALAVSSEAQERLQRSLAAKDEALRNEAAATKQREEELFIKFALLQNRQVAENKRLRAELEHYQEQLKNLQGEDEFNTDDEERAAELGAEYAADTDDDSNQGDEMEEDAAHVPAAAGTFAAAAAAAAAGTSAAAAGQQLQSEKGEVAGAASQPDAGAAYGSNGRRLGLGGMLERLISDDGGADRQQLTLLPQQQLQQVVGSADGAGRSIGAGSLPLGDVLEMQTQPLPLQDKEQVYQHVERLRQQQQQAQLQQQQQQQQQGQQLGLQPSERFGTETASTDHAQAPVAVAAWAADAVEPAAVVSKARRRRR